MGIQNKLQQYRAWREGIKHCTFNPSGPGVVRMHLIPPRFSLFRSPCYILILNGYYLLPVGYSWAVLLSAFMEEVNRFDGKPILDRDEEEILKNTLHRVAHVYPAVGKGRLREDLLAMLDIAFEIARGGRVDADVEKLSVRAYARYMEAPHRMDLSISAMTDADGAWKCNQKCLFCYAAGQALAGERELSTEEWKKIIDKLRRARVPMLTFTGGEPTQRADLAKLIDYAKWFVTRLNTNGVLLTAKLARELKQAGLDSVQVTLYSHDEVVHNALVAARILPIPCKESARPWRPGWTSALIHRFVKRMRIILKRFVFCTGLVCVLLRSAV